MIDFTKFCKSALPYLKAPVEGASENELSVLEGAFPVQHVTSYGLIAHYLVDQGHSFQYVVNEFLEKSGLTLGQLHEIAVENLIKYVGGKIQIRSSGSLHGLICGGNFEASLMAVDALWQNSLKDYVQNKIIAVAPARDILAFGDSENPDTIPELKALVDRIWPNGDHLITKSMYVYCDSGWEIYEV